MASITNIDLEFDYLDVDYSEIRNKKIEEENRLKEVLLYDTLELNLEEINDYE